MPILPARPSRPPERRRSHQMSCARGRILAYTMHNGAPNLSATAADQRAARIAVYVPSTHDDWAYSVRHFVPLPWLNGEATDLLSLLDRVGERPTCIDQMAISRTIGVLRQLRSDLRRCIGGRHAPALNSRRCLLKRHGAGEFHDRRAGLVREFAGTLALPGIAPSAVQDHRRPAAQQEVRTSQRPRRRRCRHSPVCTDRHRERPPFPR